MVFAVLSVHASGRRPPVVQYEVTPATVTAGNTMVVRFHTRHKIRSARFQFPDRTVPFFAESDGLYRAFVGVDSTELPGVKISTLTLTVGRRRVFEYPVSFHVVGGTYPVSHVKLSKDKDTLISSGQISKDAKVLRDIYTKTRIRKKLWDGLFVRPTSGVVSSVFGARRRYRHRKHRSAHSGLDIADREGTPIVAPNRGRVVFADWLDSFGYTVMLDHGQGVFSYYIHMKEQLVHRGTLVNAGDILGTMGEEGIATGPHLHWSMVAGSVRVDPQEWMKRLFP